MVFAVMHYDIVFSIMYTYIYAGREDGRTVLSHCLQPPMVYCIVCASLCVCWNVSKLVTSPVLSCGLYSIVTSEWASSHNNL